MPYEPRNLKLWTHPPYYVGECWPATYSAGVGQSRDSDCLERANFQAMLKRLGGESETVQVVHESHWAVGWVEWIAIHQDDDKALQIADDIQDGLQNYPVIDESLLSQYETEDAQLTWKNCYDDRSRLEKIRQHRTRFDFHNWAEIRQCVRGEIYCGETHLMGV